MNIVFMGSAELACPTLEALARDGNYRISAVVTQPDKPKGRDLKLRPTPVKKVALAHNLPVLQPANRVELLQAIQNRKSKIENPIDLIIVVAYGQILPQAILDVPPLGCINVHTSMLPKYRGAAPIQWALFNGDSDTGVTIMRMDAGLDTGPILSQARTPIAATDNAQTLHDRLARLGADLLLGTIPDYVAGRVTAQPQPSAGGSYARKITKEDGRIDWSKPARHIWNQVRAFIPWPGAFTHYSIQNPKSKIQNSVEPRLLKIWDAAVEQSPFQTPGRVLECGKLGIVVACGEHALRILELQLEGGRRLSAEQFLAGNPLKPGDQFVSVIQPENTKSQ